MIREGGRRSHPMLIVCRTESDLEWAERNCGHPFRGTNKIYLYTARAFCARLASPSISRPLPLLLPQHFWSSPQPVPAPMALQPFLPSPYNQQCLTTFQCHRHSCMACTWANAFSSARHRSAMGWACAHRIVHSNNAIDSTITLMLLGSHVDTI